MTFSLTLPHQRSARSSIDFWHWIFYAKEEKGTEMDFKYDLLRQRSAGSGPDFWHWIFYAKEEKGTKIDFKNQLQHQRIARLKFSTENPTPAKCREWP